MHEELIARLRKRLMFYRPILDARWFQSSEADSDCVAAADTLAAQQREIEKLRAERDDARRILTEYFSTPVGKVFAESDARQWRPIETAPQDGTPIWVHSPGWGGCQFKCEWRNGNWTDEERPTHWMPLPAPPVDPR